MASPRKIRSVAIYARLSVSTEESVSIERQIEAARKYAEARGWVVVLVEFDDGVSATKTKPEERVGWRKILHSEAQFEAVIVWKVDRLARRVLDFLHADEALQARGAGLVAVEDPVDMTTAQGRAFATMLAVFGEMEAAAISARVTAARRALLQAGRRAGGRPPFGWMNIPNPAGPGFVLARDPERVGIVSSLAERALAGASLYSLTKWLDDHGVLPRQRDKRKSMHWHEASVETILRNPVLAGMTPYRGDVVRDRDGLPVVDEEIAILTTAERRRLLAILDERKAPGSRPYGSEPALLYGLARCASCGGLLYRAKAGGIPCYRCQHKDCEKKVSVARAPLEEYVAEQLLAEYGRLPVVELEETAEADPAPQLADVEAAIADTLAALGEDDADEVALSARLTALKALRAKARADASAAPTKIARRTGQTFAEAWASYADDTAARRGLLVSAFEAVYVRPSGRSGGRFHGPSRVDIVPREDTEDLDD